MATANVVTTVSGTGWSVDVTACDLDTNLAIYDVYVLHNDVPYNNTAADYQKVTHTVLVYVGATLPANTKVEVRRKTPTSVLQPVSYASRITSDLWNKELDRTQRWKEEAELNGVGAAFSGVVPTPKDEAYSTNWNGDTTYPPTRNAVYDRISQYLRMTNTTSQIKLTDGGVTIRWGSAVMTTNANGDTTVPFGITFTNLFTVVCVDGDSTTNRTIQINGVNYGGSSTGFNVKVRDSGTAVANGTVRLNWVAVGVS